MGKNYIIIDLGTGNSRIAIASESGTIQGIKSFENNYHRDIAYEDAQYFIPEEWSLQILDLCQELIMKHPEIVVSAITSAGARESIVLYDEKGCPFYGLPNIDNRGRTWVEEIPDKEYIYERTGRWVTEDFAAAKLLGLQKKHPEIYNRITKITSLSEWIAEIFTGKIVIEPSQACETQLYDIGTKEWSSKICSYYGIEPTILPDVVNAGTTLGNVRKELCDVLHLQETTEFIVGGADTQVAVKGTGIGVGEVAVVSGTTSPVVTIVDEKYYDKQERCWTDCNLGGDTYQVETNPGVTGLNYQRFKKLFFPEMSYEELDVILKNKKRYLCTASFSSLYFTEKQSLKKGGFVMGAPLDAELELTDLAWSVVADIACSIYMHYISLCEMIPHKKSYILGCGGGFQSDVICQMVADLTRKEFVIYNGFEQASINGCVKICNQYFGVNIEQKCQGKKRFIPDHKSLVTDYYSGWLENRNMLNAI